MTTEDRLARLERANRTWRWTAVALLWGLIVTTMMNCSRQTSDLPSHLVNSAVAANAQEDTVHAKLRVQLLELVDDAGKVRGYFQALPGCSTLHVGGDSDDVQVRLAAYGPPFPAQAVVRIIGQKARTDLSGGHVCIAETPEAPEARQWFDQRWKSTHLRGHYESLARLSDPLSKDPVELEKIQRGKALLGKPSVQLGWGPGGGGMIEVLNSFNKTVVSVQANKANAGAVYVHDLNGEVVRALSGE